VTVATSTNGVMVPLEVYLKTSYRPDGDWIDGEVRERNIGEGPHAAVQKFFINFLSAREEGWHITALPEQRIQTSARNCSVPDVCAIRDDVPFEQVLTIPPVLGVEVMSYGDPMSEVLEAGRGLPCHGSDGRLDRRPAASARLRGRCIRGRTGDRAIDGCGPADRS
jgi:hypothetical protein